MKGDMKKWQRALLMLGGLTVAGFILGLSVWQQSRQQVNRTIVPTHSLTLRVVEPLDTAIGITYDFPSPGILPDNPFYMVKMSEEGVRAWFTPDPLARAHLFRDYADKRLVAAGAVLKKGKVDLAVEASVKAEGYLREALDTLKRVPVSGYQREWQTLLSTGEAHAQMLQRFQDSVGDGRLGLFNRPMEMNQHILEEVRGRV